MRLRKRVKAMEAAVDALSARLADLGVVAEVVEHAERRGSGQATPRRLQLVR